MTNKNISFQKAFDELLPLELKQMVFKYGASAEDSDIKVMLVNDTEERLNAPAVDFLAKLKQQYSANVYTQALQHLTGPTFRWVFISNTQPHRYLLTAFRRSVPMEVRERITHAYLPRVTTNVIDPVTQSASFKTLQPDGLHSPLRHSDYFTRLGMRENCNPPIQIIRAIKQDNAGGIMLLPSTLPWLEKLDLSLDIKDCSGWDRERSMKLLELKFADWRKMLIYGPLSAGLGALVNLKKITSLDIRIIWDDFLAEDQTFDFTLDGDTEKKLRDLTIKALRLSVPARSVVSYPENEPMSLMVFLDKA